MQQLKQTVNLDETVRDEVRSAVGPFQPTNIGNRYFKALLPEALPVARRLGGQVLQAFNTRLVAIGRGGGRDGINAALAERRRQEN